MLGVGDSVDVGWSTSIPSQVCGDRVVVPPLPLIRSISMDRSALVHRCDPQDGVVMGGWGGLG